MPTDDEPPWRFYGWTVVNLRNVRGQIVSAGLTSGGDDYVSVLMPDGTVEQRLWSAVRHTRQQPVWVESVG